jgi:Na+-driven multidrug efflux pump
MALQNTVLAAARGCGEFKTSFQVMLLSAVLNVILDPIFIFGWGPVPALGIVGAGLGAAMTSLCVFALVMRGALTSHGRSLDFHAFGVSQVLQSWRIISSIGAPAVITYLGAPIGWILTMKLVSAFGPTAAAGYTIGDRFHGFFVATVLSLAGALVPIVGQSWGAGRWDRVTSALAIGSRIGIVVGAGFWLSLMLVAVPLVGVLVHDQSVVSATRSFLFIVPAGYAATGFTVMCNAVLNALDRAVSGTLLEVLRSVGLPIPLAWLLGHWFGFHGVMAGLALGSILTVPPAVAIMSRTMRSYRL